MRNVFPACVWRWNESWIVMVEQSNPAVIVANPGRQHTDHLAIALHQRQLLSCYFHGVAVRPALAAMFDTAHDCHWQRYRLAVAAANKFLTGPRRVAYAHRIYRHFGRAVARQARHLQWNVALSAENSALPLFAVAQQRGALKIIDAASVHHSWQANADTAERAAVNAIKDREIAAADHIFTCSTLARQSYVDAGFDPERVHVMPLGVDLDEFTDVDSGPRTGPIKMLFVGRGDVAKGVDVVASAAEALRSQGVAFSLDCIGPFEGEWASRLAPYATLHGKVPHGELAQYFRRADLLLHPSRFDSFGLVVAESLASGTPVMVSDRTGARDLVQDDVNGWILPTGAVGDWVAAIGGCASAVERVRSMRSASRASTSHCGWPAYHERVADKIAALTQSSALTA